MWWILVAAQGNFSACTRKGSIARSRGSIFLHPCLNWPETADLSGAQLEESDALEFANKTEAAIWTTCGAINQYSNDGQLTEFIGAFQGNQFAKKLYLFDTIDPLRVVLLKDDIIESFLQPRTRGSGLKTLLKRMRGLAKAFRYRTCKADVIPLGDHRVWGVCTVLVQTSC